MSTTKPPTCSSDHGGGPQYERGQAERDSSIILHNLPMGCASCMEKARRDPGVGEQREVSMTEQTIAKKALAALTFLRQGVNPFVGDNLRKINEAGDAYPKYCEALSIPLDYDDYTMDFLQRLSRGQQPR